MALVRRDDVMILVLGRPTRHDPPRAVERQHQAGTESTTTSWIARKRLRRREGDRSDPASRVQEGLEQDRPLAPPMAGDVAATTRSERQSRFGSWGSNGRDPVAWCGLRAWSLQGWQRDPEPRPLWEKHRLDTKEWVQHQIILNRLDASTPTQHRSTRSSAGFAGPNVCSRSRSSTWSD